MENRRRGESSLHKQCPVLAISQPETEQQRGSEYKTGCWVQSRVAESLEIKLQTVSHYREDIIARVEPLHEEGGILRMNTKTPYFDI